jgi:hypothetical protein
VYGEVPSEGEAVRVVDNPLSIEGAAGEIVTVGGELTVNTVEYVPCTRGIAELSVTLAQ